MRKVLSICVALACMASGVPAAAQDAVVKRIIEIGKTDNRVMHQIDILTNRFGGRVLGSDAFENAAEWMVREYKSWGLDVDLEEAGTLPVGFNRGPWFGRMLGENSMHLHFVTPSYTSGTKGAQRGHVLIEPRTDEEFEQIKGRLKGAWVLISGTNRGFPIDRTAAGDLIIPGTAQRSSGVEDLHELLTCDGLFFKKILGALVHLVQVGSDDLRGLFLGLGNHLADFGVDVSGRLVRTGEPG